MHTHTHTHVQTQGKRRGRLCNYWMIGPPGAPFRRSSVKLWPSCPWLPCMTMSSHWGWGGPRKGGAGACVWTVPRPPQPSKPPAPHRQLLRSNTICSTGSLEKHTHVSYTKLQRARKWEGDRRVLSTIQVTLNTFWLDSYVKTDLGVPLHTRSVCDVTK